MLFLGNNWPEFLKFVDKTLIYVIDTAFNISYHHTVWDKWHKINKIKNKN